MKGTIVIEETVVGDTRRQEPWRFTLSAPSNRFALLLLRILIRLFSSEGGQPCPAICCSHWCPYAWCSGRSPPPTSPPIPSPSSDPPGAISTFPTAINIWRHVVGHYTDANFQTQGFLFDHGTFTPTVPPGTISTTPTAMNARGQLVGQYLTAGGSPSYYP